MCVNYFSIHADRFSVHLRMLSIVVIGTGNVARQLCVALRNNAAAEVVQVVSRSPEKIPDFEGYPIASFDALNLEADCYIIAVSDASIESVNQQLNSVSGLVVHTSGSIAIEALQAQDRYGVLYPLQTFSTGREIDLSQVPFFLEVKEPGDASLLQQLADSFTEKTFWIDSVKRRKLHLAAIYLNNFTNHLIYIASEQCQELEIDSDVLQPLLEETVAKAIDLGPYQAQTGPARRGDQTVIEAHLDLIDNPDHQMIYQIISQSIQTTYENELQELT